MSADESLQTGQETPAAPADLTPGKTCLAEILDGALSPLFPNAVFPQVYTGSLLEYAVWDYNQIPTLWAERAPGAARYLVQVHFYTPHKKNPQASILALSRALFDAGLTWPTVTDAADAEGQHWVLECEYCDGGGFYGYT